MARWLRLLLVCCGLAMSAAPAWACMGRTAASPFAWSAAPMNPAIYDHVLEVRLKYVTIEHLSNGWTSCDGSVFVFSVVRNLHGDFDDTEIAVETSFATYGPAMSRNRTYYLVGALGGGIATEDPENPSDWNDDFGLVEGSPPIMLQRMIPAPPVLDYILSKTWIAVVMASLFFAIAFWKFLNRRFRWVRGSNAS